MQKEVVLVRVCFGQIHEPAVTVTEVSYILRILLLIVGHHLLKLAPCVSSPAGLGQQLRQKIAAVAMLRVGVDELTERHAGAVFVALRKVRGSETEKTLRRASFRRQGLLIKGDGLVILPVLHGLLPLQPVLVRLRSLEGNSF